MVFLFASLEDLPSKLKGLVKSVKKVEAEMAALKASYLKRLNKASNIVILDSWVSISCFVVPVCYGIFSSEDIASRRLMLTSYASVVFCYKISQLL